MKLVTQQLTNGQKLLKGNCHFNYIQIK